MSVWRRFRRLSSVPRQRFSDEVLLFADADGALKTVDEDGTVSSVGGGEQGEPGVGVPAGGTTDQILAKATDADYDTEWVAPPEGGTQPVNGYDRILFDRSGDGFTTSQIYVMGADQQGIAPASPSGDVYDNLARWRPGTRDTIVFQRYDNNSGVYSVCTVDHHFSTLADLTSDLTPEQDPAGYGGLAPVWSPDGTKILFALYSDVGATTSEIWQMDSDGSNKEQLTNLAKGLLGDSLSAAWSPDGTRFAVELKYPLSAADGGIWTFDAAGGDPQHIVGPGDFAGSQDDFFLYGLSWSSRNVIAAGLVIDITGSARADVYTFSPTGGDITKITASALDGATGAGYGFPAWDPDGTRMLAMFTRSGSHWSQGILNLDGSFFDLAQVTKETGNAYASGWGVANDTPTTGPATPAPSTAIALSEPADADVLPGECIAWFDPTNGSAELNFKAKTLNGTVVASTPISLS